MPRGYGVYTTSGERVRNPSAYAATGAPTLTAGGQRISNARLLGRHRVLGQAEHVRAQVPVPLHRPFLPREDPAIRVHQAQPRPGDCALGEGVHLTGKAPRSSPERCCTTTTTAPPPPPPRAAWAPTCAWTPSASRPGLAAMSWAVTCSWCPETSSWPRRTRSSDTATSIGTLSGCV